ncbi:hypothetical protein AOLI_G00060990 [Acnodon oligacanthus]
MHHGIGGNWILLLHQMDLICLHEWNVVLNFLIPLQADYAEPSLNGELASNQSIFGSKTPDSKGSPPPGDTTTAGESDVEQVVTPLDTVSRDKAEQTKPEKDVRTTLPHFDPFSPRSSGSCLASTKMDRSVTLDCLLLANQRARSDQEGMGLQAQKRNSLLAHLLGLTALFNDALFE